MRSSFIFESINYNGASRFGVTNQRLKGLRRTRHVPDWLHYGISRPEISPLRTHVVWALPSQSPVLPPQVLIRRSWCLLIICTDLTGPNLRLQLSFGLKLCDWFSFSLWAEVQRELGRLYFGVLVVKCSTRRYRYTSQYQLRVKSLKKARLFA